MNPRRIAFTALRRVTGGDGYANLVLANALRGADLSSQDAALVTELVAGTTRRMGIYDQIIQRAGNRAITSLQPAVVDLLRLGTHQILCLDIPNRAAVATTVDLARATVGQRVTGVVNAILRKVTQRSLDEWLALLTEGLPELQQIAVRTFHPTWIAEAYAAVLPPEEVEPALAANNVAPQPTVVVRPGLAERSELLAEGLAATRYSPFGARGQGNPNRIPAVAQGRAGVQDEGSQLVAWAFSKAVTIAGPWLDLCAGPGGKSALLRGLAGERLLVSSELQEHRAGLVANSLRAYPSSCVVTADGRRPAWAPDSFAGVMADVPCSGLGALRRRPESRWRRLPRDVTELTTLQHALLASAINSVKPGGVVAYVTCSPHRAETVEIVEAAQGVDVLPAAQFLPDVDGASVGDYLQLWPHRHGTDAMFLALLRKKLG